MSWCFFVFFFVFLRYKVQNYQTFSNKHEFITKARKVPKLLVKEHIRHTNYLLKEAQRTESNTQGMKHTKKVIKI